MKRNSTTLFLESPGAITPVPWVNGAPDFSGFTPPTLGVLQKAWDERDGEPEIIPDPVPIVEPVPPDWQGFMDRLDLPEAKPNGTGLYAAMWLINSSIAGDAHQMCIRFKDGSGSVDDFRFLNFLYLQLVPEMTPEQVAALNQAIADFDIPIQI